jgi:uncharacterized protein YegL
MKAHRKTRSKVAKTKREGRKELKTYISLILDKSGSMASCFEPTIKHFNDTISKTIRDATKESESDVFVSLVTFNTEVDEIMFNTDPGKLEKLSRKNYSPSGGTALFDAVGDTIAKLEQQTDITDKRNSYVIIVISDGEEN